MDKGGFKALPDMSDKSVSYNYVHSLLRVIAKLKVTGHKKIKFFCRVFTSRQDFFHITCTFKRASLRILDLKFHKVSPFLIKNPQNLSKIFQKRTHCEILNLNNQILGRLKVNVI